MPSQPAPKISTLVGKAIADAQRLATAQVALAKTEMSATGSRIGKGSALGIVAVFLAIQASFFLLFTIGYALVQLGLPTWAAFLIVTVLLVAGSAVAFVFARKSFESITGPTVAMAELEKTREALLGPADGTTSL